MSSKTTNDDKNIATIGSLHKAITTPKGQCVYTDGSKETNFITTNECALAEAAKRTTARGDAIITVKSRIGFPCGGNKSHYVNNGTPRGNGVCSGMQPYTFAQVRRGARTLLTEAEETARTDDPTQQAYYNSPGKLREAGWEMQQADLLALLRQQCALDVITTSCGHGREIAQHDVARLEVLYKDKVTLKATRINATASDPEARKKPICLLETGQEEKTPQNSSHTKWEISRGKYPGLFGAPTIEEKKDLKFGDTLPIGPEWFGAEPEGKVKQSTKMTATPPPDPTPPGKSKAFASTTQKTQEEKDKFARQAAANTAISLAGLLTWVHGPFVTVNVIAHACAGPRTIVLVAYPDQPVKVDLLELKEVYDRISYVRKLIDNIDAVLQVVSNAAKPLGAKFTFETHWLGTKSTREGATVAKAQNQTVVDSSPLAGSLGYGQKESEESRKHENKLELEMQWKELTRDAKNGRIELKKYQVGLDFKGTFSCDNFVGLTFTGKIPLTALLSKAGKLINDLKAMFSKASGKSVSPEQEASVGLFFNFKIEFSLGGGASGGVNEYGEGEFTGTLKGHAVFSIGLSLEFAVGKITVDCAASFDPVLTIKAIVPDLRIVAQLKAEYHLIFTATVEVDCWGFHPGVSWTFEPFDPYKSDTGEALWFGEEKK